VFRTQPPKGGPYSVARYLCMCHTHRLPLCCLCHVRCTTVEFTHCHTWQMDLAREVTIDMHAFKLVLVSNE
jgi:hypothetical protein